MHTPDTPDTSESLTYTDSVDRFLATASWLTDEDLPAVTAMRMIALELDTGPFQAAIVSQFGLHYRALLKRKPAVLPTQDPLEQLLDG